MQSKDRPPRAVILVRGQLTKTAALAVGRVKHWARALWPKESIARLRMSILTALIAFALVFSLVPVLWMCQPWGALLLNLGTNLAGAVVTYVLIDLLIRPREASESKKRELIAQLGSRVHNVAIAAAEEMRWRKWLYDGTLEGARLWEANLQGAQLRKASLRKVLLGYANLQDAELPEADLDGAMLDEADLRKAFLERANLREARLSGANLQGASLRDADLERAILTRAKLQRAGLEGVNLRGAEIDETTQIDEKWRQVWGIVNQGAVGANLQRADLKEADLQGADLNEANLQEAHLSRANLQGASLRTARLERAFLPRCKMQKANLQGANLQEAQLSLANLQGANLREVNLRGAVLRWTDLQGANLEKAILDGATFDEKTTLPDGTTWTADADLARFTDPGHPDFWSPCGQRVTSPAGPQQESGGGDHAE